MELVAPFRMDLDLARNSGWVRTIFLKDVIGNPVDYTGWAIAMEVRASEGAGGSPIASATIDETDPTGGQILVSLDGADFSAEPGATELVRLAYDMRATKSGEIPVILAKGVVNLYPGVTTA